MSKISQRKRQISNKPLTKLTKSEIIYLIKEEKKKIENIKLDKMYVSEEIFLNLILIFMIYQKNILSLVVASISLRLILADAIELQIYTKQKQKA